MLFQQQMARRKRRKAAFGKKMSCSSLERYIFEVTRVIVAAEDVGDIQRTSSASDTVGQVVRRVRVAVIAIGSRGAE
jgi:hypothetical protein